MNIIRKSSISLREQRRAEERSSKHVGKPKVPVMRRIMAFLTAVVFYSFSIAPSLNYLSLEASPAVPQLDVPEFSSQDLTPFARDAASSQNVSSWEGLMLHGLSLLKAEWEEEVDAMIEQQRNAVSSEDQIHDTEQYREYIEKSLLLQKEDALADWVRAAEDALQEERDLFLSARTRFHLSEQDQETDETVLNWEMLQASYLEESQRTFDITPETLPDIFNRANDLLDIEQLAWQRDFQERLDYGTYEYGRALGTLNSEYENFNSSLDQAEALFQQNLEYITDLENQVRDRIALSLDNMLQGLFRSPQFYDDFQAMGNCGAWDSAACETEREIKQENLNAQGLELQSHIESVQAALDAGMALSGITEAMADILAQYQGNTAERRDQWENRIEGTYTVDGFENGFSQSTNGSRTYRTGWRSSAPSTDTSRFYQNNTENYGSVFNKGGITTKFGEDDTRLIHNGNVIGDLLDSPETWNRSGVSLSDGDWAELEARGRIARILEYNRTGDIAYLEGLLSDEGEVRNVTGVSVANVCGTGGGERGTGQDCFSDAGSHGGNQDFEHVFVYGSTDIDKDTDWCGSLFDLFRCDEFRRNYYVHSQTSFNTQVTYSFHDDVAEENFHTWSGYHDQVSDELDTWLNTLLPSVQNWEEQRAEFENNFANWQQDAEEQRNEMDSWYETSQIQLLSSRDRWIQEMEDRQRRGNRDWDLVRTDLRTTEMDWQDRVEQANWRDQQVQAMLRQELNAEMEGIFAAVPDRVEAEADVRNELASVRREMPQLQESFLKQGEDIPDTNALFDLVEQFSRAATAMMNMATVDSLNDRIDELRDQPLQMAMDILEDHDLNIGDTTQLCDNFNMCQNTFNFNEISQTGDSIIATRSILSGEGRERSGKDGRKTHHYNPGFQEQQVRYSIGSGGSVAVGGPDSIFDRGDTATMMQEFMSSMQEFQQSAMRSIETFQSDLQAADQVAIGNLNHYTDWVTDAVDRAENSYSEGAFTRFMSSSVGQVLSTALTVASFIPVTAPFALAAQGVLAVAQGVEQGGWKGGLAAAGSAYLSNYTGGAVNISYSHDDGWGGSVGANLGGVGSFGVSYTKDGGFGATAGVGVGDFQAGAAWNQEEGFLGAQLGYTGFDNMNLGLSYDAENGFGGSMEYNNGTYAGGLAYNEGQGLSGSAAYTHHNDMGGFHRAGLEWAADGSYDIGLDSRFDSAYEVGRHVDSTWFEGAYSNSVVLDTRLGFSSEDGAYFDHDVNLRAATDNRIVANDERYTTCSVDGTQGVCQIREDGLGPDHSTFQHTSNFMNEKLGCSGGQCEENVDNFVGLGMNTNIRGTEETCAKLREENGGTCFGIENTTGINGLAAVTNAMGYDMTGQSDRWANFMGDANQHMHDDTTSFFHSDGTSNYLLAAEKYKAATDNPLDMGGGDIHLAGTPLVNPLLGNSEEKLAERLQEAGVSGDQVTASVYGADPIGAGITSWTPWKDLGDHKEGNYLDYVLNGDDSEKAGNMNISRMGEEYENSSRTKWLSGAAIGLGVDEGINFVAGLSEEHLGWGLNSYDPDPLPGLQDPGITGRFGTTYNPGSSQNSFAEQLGIERRDFYQQQSAENAATVAGWAEDGATAILESETVQNLASLIGQEDKLQEQIDGNLAETLGNLANEEAYAYLNEDIRDHIEEESSFWGEEGKLVMPGVIP